MRYEMGIELKQYRIILTSIIFTTICLEVAAQINPKADNIFIEHSQISPTVYLLYCTGGFGGGNVAASIGKDGILLVDNMFAHMASRLESNLSQLSDKPIRIIVNTHFHRDHIEGNSVFRKSSVIIAHKNVPVQLQANNKDSLQTANMLPVMTFDGELTIQFNGEHIHLIHVPKSHTNSDVIVYFSQSKILHLGDLFFAGMFPGIYPSAGGDVKGLISSLEKVLHDFPRDTRVIPGHGKLATMDDLSRYVTMLRETTAWVEEGIRNGKSLEQMKEDRLLEAYDGLGKGGAQSTDQYLTMLYNSLKFSHK